MKLLIVILLAMLPISELRGAIPTAILANGMNPFLAFLLCVCFNILIVPFVFLFLYTAHGYFYKIEIYKKLFDKFIVKSEIKLKDKFEKYGYFALTLFTAIPLPVTGAYTATLASFAMQLDKKKSFMAIALGVVIAGIIVTLVTLSIDKLPGFFHLFIKS
jgi:uncharacterized membrane protein